MITINSTTPPSVPVVGLIILTLVACLGWFIHKSEVNPSVFGAAWTSPPSLELPPIIVQPCDESTNEADEEKCK